MSIHTSHGIFQTKSKYSKKSVEKEDNCVDMGITINNIGKCFYRQKDYSQALKQYGTVLELIQKVNLNDHVDMAYTLKNIGEVYMDLLSFDFALTYFTKALDIYKKTFDDLEHREIA